MFLYTVINHVREMTRHDVMMFIWTKISSKCAIKLCNAQSYFEENQMWQHWSNADKFSMGYLKFLNQSPSMIELLLASVLLMGM